MFSKFTLEIEWRFQVCFEYGKLNGDIFSSLFPSISQVWKLTNVDFPFYLQNTHVESCYFFQWVMFRFANKQQVKNILLCKSTVAFPGGQKYFKQESYYSDIQSSLFGDSIEKWGGDKFFTKQDLLAKGFLFLILSTSVLFICFWTDLVSELATTRNTSTVAGYTRV